MKNIGAIVFDLGGVLVELSGVSTILNWSGLPMDEATLWQRWLTSPSVRAFESGQIATDDFADQIIVEMQLSVSRQQFLEAFAVWPKGLYPGVTALLNILRDRFTLACLSNTSELHWPRLMNEMGLASQLDHHFASHLMGKIKPDVECFEHMLQDLNLSAGQVLFFDDNIINVDGAKKVGIHAVKVNGIEDVERSLKEFGLLPKS